jgi:hypothetical protein
MAHSLAPKAPTETVERRWTVPVDADDAPLSVVASASGVTVAASSFEGDELVLTISGGTAAATGAITATVTTSQGRVLVETLYIPVIVSTALGQTARDIILFALRKVSGLGEEPDADEADDALERLNDMLARWRVEGADCGVSYPLALSTVVYAPDAWLSAIKHNLILEVADIYAYDPGAVVVRNARTGLQAIKQANVTDTATAVYY